MPPPAFRPSAPPPAASKGSPLLWVAVGGLATIVLVGAIGVLVLLRTSSRSSDANAAADASLAPVLLVVDAASSADAAPSASAVKPPPLTDEERDELAGNYTCSIDDTAAFPCRVANGTLEKTAGSQRFRGPIKKLPDGNLSFSGTFFCPFGDCTRPVACTFVRQGPGRYVGRFGPDASGGPGNERIVLNKVR